ncbi:hypothetical protein C8N40_104306 [Pontibacter mucosus]|uniref:Lipocalin-like protein n=1 Tax=Pontibacter mucosus TaxID=1649266 RepID=A0A2T5YJT6_9BACT|nr:hypothetical protein [Pontibacter mucosus]PTX19574.1 hypothetical protein C8N40_104306 [Pontibacter mucosus]
MKRSVFAILCLLFLLTGCEKDNADLLETSQTENSLVGTWELRTVSGGWTGTTEYKPGNGNIYRFTKDTYERITDGTKYSGKYLLKDGVSSLSNKPIKRIIFYDAHTTPNVDDDFGLLHVEVKDNILVIAMDAYDAGASTYARKVR